MATAFKLNGKKYDNKHLIAEQLYYQVAQRSEIVVMAFMKQLDIKDIFNIPDDKLDKFIELAYNFLDGTVYLDNDPNDDGDLMGPMYEERG